MKDYACTYKVIMPRYIGDSFNYFFEIKNDVWSTTDPDSLERSIIKYWSLVKGIKEGDFIHRPVITNLIITPV